MQQWCDLDGSNLGAYLLPRNGYLHILTRTSPDAVSGFPKFGISGLG